jgi:hypothetical protein
MKQAESELEYRLNYAGLECLTLWVNHVAPSEAPRHARKTLSWLYGDFSAAKLGVYLLFKIRTSDCKTPEQLRQRAHEAIAKLNELSANGTPTDVVVARYKAWAT